MNQINKGLIICFIGITAVINITILTNNLTRRTADDEVKIESAKPSKSKVDQYKDCLSGQADTHQDTKDICMKLVNPQ